MAEKLLVEFSGKKNLDKYARLLVSGNDLSKLTEFALRAPNPIWAAAYPSFTTLAQHSNTRYVDIKDVDDLLLLRNAIRDGLIEDVETVVFDRLDEIQRRMFLNRMITEKRDVLKNEDWNWMESKLNQVAKGFSDLEVNLIFIVAPKDVGGYDGQDLVTKPDIQGGFASDIFSYIDYALWLDPEYKLSIDRSKYEGIFIQPPDTQGGVPMSTLVEDIVIPDSLRIYPNIRYPWIFDATDTLTGDESIQEIIQLRETIKVEESQDPIEIVFGPVEDSEEKDTDIPGMSKADKLNKIFKQTKSKAKGE